MDIITIDERHLEQGVMDGIMYIECPYCGGEAQAEPDAWETCCQDCDKHFKINNPYI